jgi:hypothetical protein
MLAAEQGKPFKALNRSVEPPPEERELIASGATWGTSVDDERLSQLPDLPAEEPEVARTAERRHRGGLLGWLFGDSDDDEAPPPPPPRSGR